MENIEFNKLTESLPINSDKDFINFSEFRKVLKEKDNLIGKTEKFGVRFTRKFVNNVLDNTIRLYYTNVKRIVKENTKLIANLCIVHGFGHHSQEFYELAFYLANQGINCHLIDFRGSGYSGGCRFDWTIEELQTDLITLIKTTEVDGIDLPIFIFGHSMGGGLVASLFINNQYLQVNGVILSAPLLGLPLNQPPNTLKFFLLSKLGNDMKEFLLNGRIRILDDKKTIPFANPRDFRSIIKNCERLLENCR
jgi:acylglycerol lipase